MPAAAVAAAAARSHLSMKLATATAAAAAASSSRRRPLTYFCKQQHLWLRTAAVVVVPKDDSDDNDSEVLRCKVQMGLTERGIDSIGDVTSIERSKSSRNNKNNTGDNDGDAIYNTYYQAGEKFMAIKWEGFMRTESDELYHAVWSTVDGTCSLTCPVTGHVAISSSSSSSSDTGEMDEETVLAEILCTETDLHHASQHWVDQQDYDAFVKDHAAGKFADN